MIFKEINFKNTYAKNIKNKNIININFEDLCDIYNLQILVFYREERLKSNFISVIFWIIFYSKQYIFN